MRYTLFILFVLTGLISCDNTQEVNQEAIMTSDIEQLLKLYGHRNWIVVADAAYPMQSRPGIETILWKGDYMDAVKKVKAMIETSDHVNANIFMDMELNFLEEKDVSGISSLKKAVNNEIQKDQVSYKLHEQIIQELDSAANLFNVLVIKTEMTFPYTSVFFQLDCDYWDEKKEADLRSRMKLKK